MIDAETVRRAVRTALAEDVGSGDRTTRLVIAEGTRARGRIVAREALTAAGLGVAEEVFRQVDPAVTFRHECADGDLRAAGEALASVEGPARPVLTSERTALNFLQRMCGIATATRRAVTLLAGAAVQISDTRKTAPGLRPFDKHAVACGGGTPHRSGLFDAILIKDNHWRLAGGVAEGVRRARLGMPEGATGEIEVEVGSLEELEAALRAGADAVLLDNMDRTCLAAAVTLARGRAFLEVSGGVREEDIPFLATLRIDRISMGGLTHSARAADLALEIEPA